MTVDEAIAAGADAMAEWEKSAKKAKSNARGILKEMMETIHGDAIIGIMETRDLATEIDALATRHEHEVWALHHKLTARAKELGIDLPSTADGGR